MFEYNNKTFKISLVIITLHEDRKSVLLGYELGYDYYIIT